jgi:RND family efflux transporter MFP subunit
MRRTYLLFVFAALCLIGAACSAPQPADEPTPTPVPTAVKPTFTVQRGEIVIRTELGGRIVPLNSKPASFAMDGDVGNVYVQVGDHVEPGQLLADLDVLKDLEDQWAKASIAAKYEETISNNTIQRAQIKLQITQLNLDDLKAKGASQAALQAAALQVQLAQIDLDEVKANPELHTSLEKAQQLELALADAQLKAPIAGYIVSAPRVGQTFRKTADAFLIGDISQLEIGATALEETLKQLTEGMTVTVVVEAHPEKSYPGVIRQLPYPFGTGGDGSTDVRVTMNLTPAQAGLKLGDRMLIQVVLQDKPNALWLPPQAIRTVGGRTFVVTQDAVKGQQRVDVTLGLQTHERIEILAGLTDGQLVVGP